MKQAPEAVADLSISSDDEEEGNLEQLLKGKKADKPAKKTSPPKMPKSEAAVKTESPAKNPENGAKKNLTPPEKAVAAADGESPKKKRKRNRKKNKGGQAA